MIAQWLFGALLFATLCGVAALAVEHVMHILGRPSRLPWAVALVAALCWPFLAPLVLDATAPDLVNGVLTTAVQANGSSAPALHETSWLISLWAGRFDSVFVVVWAMATALLAVQTVFAIVVLRRIRQRATRMRMHGEDVLIDDTVGPAVIGVMHPAIVMPTWLLELDAPLQTLVLRHEREHCRAHDALLVWLSVVATTLVPWNIAVWWMARRLRAAMEIDCDARTLRDTTDRSQYAKLLLLIAQHKSSARFAPALSHSTSQLHRRIRAMHTPSIRFRSAHVVLAVGVAAVATATACSSRVTTNLTSPANGAASAASAPALLPSTTPDNYPTSETPPYFDFQVTQPATMAPGSKGPTYPAELRAAKKQGQVLAQFVVNTDGTVDMSTIKILKTDDEQFSTAVRGALSEMRFSPATLGGKNVRQLLQQPFMFSMGDNRSGTESPSATPAAAGTMPVLKAARMRDEAVGPAYPQALKDSKLEGQVLTQFVVGPDGKVDMSTFKVLKSTHELFTNAVRAALENMPFDPATKDGIPVRQMLQIPFQFSQSK